MSEKKKAKDEIDPKLRAKYLKLKKKLAIAEAVKQKYEEEHKIEFFEPLEHQARVFKHLDDGKKTILMQGANRIGKTVEGAVFVGSECLGSIRPWTKDEPTLFGGRPLKVRILCSDWEHHAAEVVVPKLKEWLPVGSYQTRKNNVGVEAFFTFPKTKSTIELITHKMDTKQLEGWAGHIVWADEPPPRDKFVALVRGLVDNHGIFLFTMTAVSEAWILDEIAYKNDHRIGKVTSVPIRANSYLDEEAIQRFEASLNENERIARIEGGWLSLTGLVLPEFDLDIHVAKEPIQIMSHWPVVPFIDIHLRAPQAISFYAYDERDFMYVKAEVFENMPPEGIADTILSHKRKYGWNITEAYIDPFAKGDEKYVKNRMDIPDSFSVIDDILRPHGILLQVASKDKDSGVINLQNRLEGPNKTASIMFDPSCKRHIWEIQRWKYDKDTQKPEKIREWEQEKHMMENTYRATLISPIINPGNVYARANKSVIARAHI